MSASRNPCGLTAERAVTREGVLDGRPPSCGHILLATWPLTSVN